MIKSQGKCCYIEMNQHNIDTSGIGFLYVSACLHKQYSQGDFLWQYVGEKMLCRFHFYFN